MEVYNNHRCLVINDWRDAGDNSGCFRAGLSASYQELLGLAWEAKPESSEEQNRSHHQAEQPEHAR
jgi:hypothetical protein